MAKNKENQNLPIGNQLANELKQQFNLPGDFTLPQISTILEKTKRDDFYNYLKNDLQ